MSKKFWVSTSVILIILLGMSSYKHYRESMIRDTYRRIFVNHLYVEVYDCVGIMSGADWNNQAAAQRDFENILKHLQRIDDIIEYAHDFMNHDIYNSPIGDFRFISYVIGEGLVSNNEKICDGFFKDGKLSENEKNFLSSLQKDLEEIKNRMYSDETKQENRKLTIKQINDILKPFFFKYGEMRNLNLSNE